MVILGIETSCDETAVAILEIKNGSFKVLSNEISSSVKLQARYGGIVPEVAARKQMEYLIPALERALKSGRSNIKNQISKLRKDIDYIAVVNGPGLITSLRVGLEAGKTLSYVLDKPLVEVNHLEGHIYSTLLNNFQFPIYNFQTISKSKILNSKFIKLPKIKFPTLALLVSGGHTQLVLMRDYLNYKIIGQTQDDAVGEAFDKVAKILDLGYPGGPIISKLAEKGDKNKYEVPRPMINSGDFNFSFSGIKTSILYTTLKHKNIKTLKQKRDLCAGFQTACVEVLVKKTIAAAEKYKVKTILLGGGVSANKELRRQLQEGVKELEKVELLIPDVEYTGDNALMIALAGYYKIKAKKISSWQKIKVDPNLEI